MNSSDINSIIDNLCDKLGTTANKLIPEMAGYQIARGGDIYGFNTLGRLDGI